VRPTPAAGLPLLVVFILGVELLTTGDGLEYRRSMLAAEPWRLLTGHFVHLSLIHALLNGVALLLLGRLFDRRLLMTELWAVLVGAPIAISLVFWIAMPQLAWYRGLSGALHTIYFAGCITWLSGSRGHARWLPLAALVGGALKVTLEQPWDASFPFRDWLGAAVVPQAHLVGALLGIVAGLGISALHAHRMSRSESESV
jgi:rhomboid family GlyGly-CTERM serine protease